MTDLPFEIKKALIVSDIQNNNGYINREDLTNKTNDNYDEQTFISEGSDEIYKNKKVIQHSKQHILHKSTDLYKMSISDLLKMKNNSFSGVYYKKLLKEVIYPLEKKQIKSIPLTKKIKTPEIVSINFKIPYNTNFGESLLLTGSIKQLGMWGNHIQMTYIDGFWVKEIKENAEILVTSEQKKDERNTPEYEYSQMSYSTLENTYNIKKRKTSDFDDLKFEFKFILNQHGNFIWESIPNRTFDISENLDIIENLLNTEDDQPEELKYFVKNMTCFFNTKTKNLTLSCVWNG